MHFKMRCSSFLLFSTIASAQAPNMQCPDSELACHDVMNSSQCIASILDNPREATKDALIQCVEHEGTASNLPGAQKVSDIAVMIF
ncbi:hypothetical protein QBC36DRAFT_14717 [Triangularia setosa]|uniref:Uncharacterized protein n=1 Tax=Triangularia setosa TaxID=2587417 RepID=A0AAN6W6B6_9PEZI|nr:hypothetical protein QBC36DRAFT_14717 [Podospora setosa]